MTRAEVEALAEGIAEAVGLHVRAQIDALREELLSQIRDRAEVVRDRARPRRSIPTKRKETADAN